MRDPLTTVYVATQLVRQALRDENGQDLVEYALVLVGIAFATAAGMSSLASNINAVFTSIGNTLTNSIS